MQTVRVIPCLDVTAGRVVKGVNFVDLIDAGDPVELAARYDDQGADELVFLDITATSDDRATMVDVVERTADVVFIPLTVGGGIRSVADARAMLRAGADKVSVNSAAVADPSLISTLAEEFGSQCVVVAVDARRRGDGAFEVVTHGGRTTSDWELVDWLGELSRRGAGEVLLTSMDRDGTRVGYDLELLELASAHLQVPLIASGGVGDLADLVAGAVEGCADGLLAASIFHLGTHTIGEAKAALQAAGVPVRP